MSSPHGKELLCVPILVVSCKYSALWSKELNNKGFDRGGNQNIKTSAIEHHQAARCFRVLFMISFAMENGVDLDSARRESRPGRILFDGIETFVKTSCQKNPTSKQPLTTMLSNLAGN